MATANKVSVIPCGAMTADLTWLLLKPGRSITDRKHKDSPAPWVDVPTHCVLVETDEGKLLWDTSCPRDWEERWGPTGLQEFFPYDKVSEEEYLDSRLNQMGVGLDEIDYVVLSHLHFDHAGGLLTPWREGAAPELLFPRATFVVGREAWERALRPHPRDRASFVPAIQALLEASGRLSIVDGPTSPVLGDGYRFHVSHGHTPGLLLTEVTMPEGPVVFAGDLIPGTPWVHLPITMGYDRHPELLIDEKERLLTDLVARGGRLFYTHDPEVALSGVARDERGRFVPTAPQAALRDLAA